MKEKKTYFKKNLFKGVKILKSDTKNSGITLIALIITIIILLILAGITISQLTGNGIFAKVKKAKQEYENAQKAEEQILGEYEKGINSKGLSRNTKETPAGTEVALEDGWGTETIRYFKTSDGTEVKGLQKVATVYAVSAGNGETIPVPYGFYYVGGNLETGVIISDNSDDKYESGKDKTTHEYATSLKGNQFVWIPCSVSNYKKYSWGYQNNGWDTSTNAAEKEQIEKYGGFYIGRYEAGAGSVTSSSNTKFGDTVSASSWQNSCYSVGSYTLSGTIASKANEIPFFHADYKTAVTMAERMYRNDNERNKYVTSGLVTGTQWDVMLNYMSDESSKLYTETTTDHYVDATNSSKYTDLKGNSDWGNYNNIALNNCRGKYCTIDGNGNMTSAWTEWKNSENQNLGNTSSGYYLLTTGSTETVKKKNLYDVAGNLWEWSQECVSQGYYMLRGGSFGDDYASDPACYRNYYPATYTCTSIGFRVTLYIK